MTTLDRYRGCLLGLAAGDALGTTLEFTQPGSFEPLKEVPDDIWLVSCYDLGYFDLETRCSNRSTIRSAQKLLPM